MNRYKETFLIGLALGTILPYIGITTGLIKSQILASILFLPQVLMSSVIGVSFESYSISQRILSLTISIVFWTVITYIYRSLAMRHIRHK
jgi:ABC-type dipeptide/oligopeptide/nickel transport system permease subunit